MPDRWHYDKRAGLVVPVDEQGERISPPPYICRGIAPGKGPLIAAAPDLLAACEAYQAAEDHHDSCEVCGPEHWCETGGELYNAARNLRKAATAKVRGGGSGG